VAAAPPPPGDAGVNTVRNASLESPSRAGADLPDCFSLTGYGKNKATLSRVTDAHSGRFASRIVMSSHTGGDTKLVQRFDLGQCSQGVTADHPYEVSVWFESDLPVFFSLYWRDAVGRWSFWTQSPRLAPAKTWTRAAWITPVPPAGAVAASFGLSIDAVGTLTTDDYGFADHPLLPAPDGVNVLRNPSLETPGAGGFPGCWRAAGYGVNHAVYRRVRDAARGTYAERLDVTSRRSGDAKLVAGWDSGNCAPLVTPGRRLTLSAAYHATVPAFVTVYRQDSSGAWSYWTQSPAWPVSHAYRTGSWRTPPVPDGTTAVTFGVTLARVGSLTTDAYSLVSGP
jgi:hypothetical protein